MMSLCLPNPAELSRRRAERPGACLVYGGKTAYGSGARVAGKAFMARD